MNEIKKIVRELYHDISAPIAYIEIISKCEAFGQNPEFSREIIENVNSRLRIILKKLEMIYSIENGTNDS